MIYLDNTATTEVKEEVLETFIQVTKQFIGNPNSIHLLGLQSKKLMEEATSQVANLLKVKPNEIIFTSSSSESNNLAIKGILSFYKKRNKLVITTPLEHASVLETIQAVEEAEVLFTPLDETGHIKLDELEKLLQKEPVLVTIQHVNSETGIIQDITSISKLIKKYPKTFFHVDGTQSVGKIPVDLENVDLFTFSAHKFFGLKGTACLIKKEKVNLTPLIHGGTSQSNYRAGTPSVALIASLAKALRLALENQKESYQHVKQLNCYLRKELIKIPNISLNSKEEDSPYIINFSILNQKPETMIHRLEAHGIYISTNTACSSKNTYSKTLLALGKEKDIAKSSLRIGLSSMTKQQEVETFIKILREEILTNGTNYTD